MSGAEVGWVREDRIAELAALPENWDSYHAKPPTPAALEALCRLWVVPTVDGGVQVEWHGYGWDVEIEFAPDGTPISFYQDRDL